MASRPPSSNIVRDAGEASIGALEAPAVTRLREGDSPSVFREVLSREALERDPRLQGRLVPPPPDALPPLMRPRAAPASLRLMTINIHMGIRGDRSLDPKNEDLLALRDVARTLVSVNPDVVVMQELRQRPWLPHRPGLGEVLSIIAHLIAATDVAFTPALARDPEVDFFRHYGTAIFSRNGFRLARAANLSLPTSTPDVEVRSAGVAQLRFPDQRPAAVVISTHLAYRREEDRQLRRDQLSFLASLSRALLCRETFCFRDALEGTPFELADFPPGPFLLAGDLNQLQADTDPVLGEVGLRHAYQLLREEGPDGGARATAADVPTCEERRIDHVYAAGLRVLDAVVAPMRPRECEGPPTDHHAVVVDLRL